MKVTLTIEAEIDNILKLKNISLYSGNTNIGRVTKIIRKTVCDLNPTIHEKIKEEIDSLDFSIRPYISSPDWPKATEAIADIANRYMKRYGIPSTRMAKYLGISYYRLLDAIEISK